MCPYVRSGQRASHARAMCCASLRSLDRGCSPPQAREQSLAAFHESLEALRRAIRTEQEDTITGIIERLEPLRQGIEERQESLSWAAKRLADDKLAAVERQQRHVEQLLEGVRRGDASSDALSYPLVPCTDSNFLCLPEVAEAAAGIQTLGSACGRFFELAMEGGTAEAHHWLGIRYQTGDGVPQDLAKAVRHFEISAAAGSVDAQFSLACRFLNGEGTARSLTEGLRLLTRAADSGHPDAQNALATRYFTGNGVARNVPTAIKYFRMAADGLQRVAAYNLATCYYNGDGVEQNYALAVQYYRQAADAGLPKAQLLLAELYEAGEGVAQDIDMALRYWQMAADQGEPDAQNAYAETIIQQYPVRSPHPQTLCTCPESSRPLACVAGIARELGRGEQLPCHGSRARPLRRAVQPCGGAAHHQAAPARLPRQRCALVLAGCRPGPRARHAQPRRLLQARPGRSRRPRASFSSLRGRSGRRPRRCAVRSGLAEVQRSRLPARP